MALGRLDRLLGLENGANALIENTALLSEEFLPLAPGDDVDRYGLLFLGGTGIRVGIYAQDFVVEEYSLVETRKRSMSFALVECHVAAVIGGGAFVGWEIGMGGPGRAIQSV